MSDVKTIHPNQILGLMLWELARLVRRRFEQVGKARELSVTRAQASVLSHLARNEGTNQVKLAQMMDLEPITLVRLLDRLQAAGLVERRPDPGDRRARSLYLTRSARGILAEIDVISGEVREEALAGFAEHDREALLGMLMAMKGNLIDQITRHHETSPPGPAPAGETLGRQPRTGEADLAPQVASHG